MNKRQSSRLFRQAVDLFVELLEQIQKRKVNYKCNDADTKAWNKFIETLDERKITIGEDFVRKFIQYGVQSWFNPDTNKDGQYNYSVRFSWMVSQKAIQRWDKFGNEINVKITRGCLKQNFDIDTVQHKTKCKGIVLKLRPVEEKFKKEFFGTKRGLAWCIANTTLYHHRSPLCVQCKFKVECKKILKQNYYKVYKVRGYDIR